MCTVESQIECIKFFEANTIRLQMHHVNDTVYELLVNKPLLSNNVEQTKYVLCYIEEFILVDIWIHCCTVHETGLKLTE